MTRALALLLLSGCFVDNFNDAIMENASTSGASSSEGEDTGTPISTSSHSADDGGSGEGEGSSGTVTPGSSDGSSSSTSGAISTSDDGASESSESESSTGAEATEYSDCYDGPITAKNQLCPQSCVVRETWSACAPDCGEACPEGGVCLEEMIDGAAQVCVLPCRTDLDCDEPMACKPFTTSGETIAVCMWR